MCTVHIVFLLCPELLRRVLHFLSTFGGIPIFSFRRFLMHARAFLLGMSSSSAKMFVKYSVCASLSCFFKSLSIPLYRFQSATFPVFLDFDLVRFHLRMSRRMPVFTHGSLQLCLMFLCGMCFFISLFCTSPRFR